MVSRFSVSIRSILLAGFCGLTAVGIALALYLGLSAAFQNTRQLLTENVDGFVNWMVDEIDGRLRPVEAQARWIAERIGDSSIYVRGDATAQTEIFFQTVLSSTPEAGAVALIAADGTLRQWTHGSEKAFVADWSANAGVMAWLEQGETDPRTEWGPPIWLQTLDTAAIVHQTPLHDSQGYLGYLVFAVPIADLSRHLARIDKNAFVLAGKDDVLAHPLMIDWRPMDSTVIPSASSIYEGTSALIPLRELGDPILERIWEAEYQELAVLEKTDEFRAVAADIGDRQFVYIYRTITGFGPKPLTVGAYFDAEASDDVIDRLGGAAIAGLGLVVIAVVLGLFVARAIGRPVRALAQASEAVQKGRFDLVPVLPHSHVAELNSAISSFEGMVQGLEEREVIRRTLGRYVPESIAEQLLKDGGGLTPVEVEATILFTDIAGFTALTEELGPARIVEVLNAYFSRMTEIIEGEGGVITQFQGDAILAIFNVPVVATDHAERACRAAAMMQADVERQTFAGQTIRSRIGINTGPVIAGAVGAEGRLTYTVHGDAVNRAARVEAMNKETGTTLLITEATARLAAAIPLREIGDMAVRGQSEVVTVYTINTED